MKPCSFWNVNINARIIENGQRNSNAGTPGQLINEFPELAPEIAAATHLKFSPPSLVQSWVGASSWVHQRPKSSNYLMKSSTKSYKKIWSVDHLKALTKHHAIPKNKIEKI